MTAYQQLNTNAANRVLVVDVGEMKPPVRIFLNINDLL